MSVVRHSPLNYWNLGIKAVLCFLNERAEVCVRYNTLKTNQAQFEDTLKVEGMTFKEGAFLEEAYYLKGIQNLQNSPSFKRGEWTVQDESAMLVAHVMRPEKGDKILDVCSAPGGKSIHMAELMNNEGSIVSCDVHAHKLELIAKNAECMRSEERRVGKEVLSLWYSRLPAYHCTR